MAIDTLYQLTLKQGWGTPDNLQENVFFYSHTAGDGIWSDLNVAFGDAILSAINAIQTQFVKNVSIDTINMGVPTDFGFTPALGTGSVVGQSMSPQDAVSYTLKVNTRAVRKGSKRFSGVPEAVQSDGTITDATYLANMDLLRIALQQELVDADNTWLPVIVKRIKEPVTGTVPLQYTYRLPTVGDVLTLGEVVVALTSPSVKHQVSRSA